MSFTPRVYQQAIISHIVTHKRCAVLAGMGMGKTSSTLAALDYLNIIDDTVCPVLILAPLRVAVNTWPDEVKKWGFNLRVSVITGTPAQRLRALNTPAEIYTTNYENSPWLVKACGDKWPFHTVVADESTRLKSFRLGGGGSSRAKALGKVAWRHVERFIELTGTPAPNGLLDLWGQLWFLDKGQALGASYRAFTSAFFVQRQVGASAFAVTYEPRPEAQEEINRRIAPLCVSLNARDYFDIDEPIISPVRVTLPPAARKVYEDLKKDMLTKLTDGTEITAVSAAAVTVKCLQVASGAIYDEAGAWRPVHDAKIEALKSIIEEAAGEPVLVAYHWQADLERCLKAIPGSRVLDKNPKTLREWNAGKIPVLFAHPASAGHGLNLQDGGHIMAVFSEWWDLEQYQQIIERIGPTRQAQAGHPRPVFIYHIIAEGTVDELVLERMKSKRKVQDILLEALKKE